jgi:hypothetical protein
MERALKEPSTVHATAEKHVFQVSTQSSAIVHHTVDMRSVGSCDSMLHNLCVVKFVLDETGGYRYMWSTGLSRRFLASTALRFCAEAGTVTRFPTVDTPQLANAAPHPPVKQNGRPGAKRKRSHCSKSARIMSKGEGARGREECGKVSAIIL